MKQFLSLFLAVLILGTRVGYALNVHYCGSEIASVSLAYNPSNCEMEMKDKNVIPLTKSFSKKTCCKDTVLLFQNDEPQKVSFENTILLKAPLNAILNRDFHKVSIPVLSLFSKENWNPPPPDHNNIILLQHRLVFYG
jgi:hypothetical protein